MLGRSRTKVFVNAAIALMAAILVSGLGARPAAAISWSHPHHAYVIFANKDNQNKYYIKEISVDENPSPPRYLRGPKTGLCQPSALTIGPQGDLYVSGFLGPKCLPAVEIFAAHAQGDVPPIGIIAGNLTRMNSPGGIALDASGKLYAAEGGIGTRPGAIDVYAAGATGNVAPIARIAGPKTTLGVYSPDWVAVDDIGEIFAVQTASHSGSGADEILKFQAGANGNVAPLAVGFFAADYHSSELSYGVTPRGAHPGIYEFSATDLSQGGFLTDPRFSFVWGDVDHEGKVYVQDIVHGHQFNRGRLFEYNAGSQTPNRIRDDGGSDGGGYTVVGP